MKQVIFIFSLLFISLVSIGQHICGFDEMHSRKMEQDLNYRRGVQENEKLIKEIIEKNKSIPAHLRSAEEIFTIPIVVHIIHTGGAVGTIYNPSDNQIISAINYVNQAYSGALSNNQGAGDIKIRFELAKRDPNCNPTDGIVRYNASGIPNYVTFGVNQSGSSGLGDESLKNLSRWDPSNYYNIWVVNKIDGEDGTAGQFVAGYAYFPGAGNVDGTVALATQTRSGTDLLIHELGHAFALYHPFQCSRFKTECPGDRPCFTNGDLVDDTQPISYNIDSASRIIDFTPRTGQINPCAGGALFTVNTELNFMNYISNSSLFTTGQKERMRTQASSSRLSLSKSNGDIPTYLSPACPPKVNFSVSSLDVTEILEMTSGCRGYKDYSIQLDITSSPVSAATVTFSTLGTAIKGVDYDIFADINSATPSDVLVFPAGSYNSKNISLRIYDDASVESNKTINLSYSVNGGGASVGVGIPEFNVTIRDNDKAPSPNSALIPVAIGTSNTTLAQNSPFRGEKARNRLQVLFLASELTSAGIKAGPINGINLRVATKNSTTPFRSLQIAIGQTTSTQLSSANGFVSGLTTVRSGADYNTVQGLNTFSFSTPFNWDGASNIVLQFCYGTAVQSTGNFNDLVEGVLSPLGSLQSASLIADFVSGSSSGCTLAPVTGLASRPLIEFIVPSASNPVASAIISRESYLGPNADVYFYGQNGTILARIINNNSFDYGCTKVEIDRVGTGTKLFWNNNLQNSLTQKTFKVTPQNPNPNGNYQISLYYSNAEKSGYESVVGPGSWANVQMVKTVDSINQITPSNPQQIPVTLNTNTVKSVYGSDHIVTGTFINGFSGFAVGSPGIVSSVSNFNELKGLYIYPNPVQKQLYLQFDQSQRNVQIRLLAIDGRVIKIENINGSMKNHILNIDKVQPGYYLLEVMTSEGRKTVSIIKQ